MYYNHVLYKLGNKMGHKRCIACFCFKMSRVSAGGLPDWVINSSEGLFIRTSGGLYCLSAEATVRIGTRWLNTGILSIILIHKPSRNQMKLVDQKGKFLLGNTAMYHMATRDQIWRRKHYLTGNRAATSKIVVSLLKHIRMCIIWATIHICHSSYSLSLC